MFAAKNLTLGQANALYKKLGGEQIVLGILDGTVKFIVETVKSTLKYPDWVRKHLTPELEATSLRDPGEVELWLDPRQSIGNPYPTGHEVYDAIKAANLFERSLSFGDLKFFEENPDQIPAEFRGKWIYGWASVVRGDDDNLHVPCLDCDAGRPCVSWDWLGLGWIDREPAGLRK